MNEQLEALALRLALSHVLCDSDDLTLEQQYEQLLNDSLDGVVIWEPLEDRTIADILDDIDSLKNSFVYAMNAAINSTKGESL